MKAKLIKSPNGEHYYLTVDGKIFAEIGGHPLKSTNHKALSLKNCQAIERGYDLDELSCDEIGIDISVIKHIDSKLESHSSPCIPLNEGGCVGAGLYHMVKGFEIGFQKALEIIGDKKFSEEDMINFAEYCKGDLMKTKDLFNEYQSLQQTEWDVEIEMEKCGYCEGCNKAGMLHCAHADSCGFPIETERPKLDADGCLILKRI